MTPLWAIGLVVLSSFAGAAGGLFFKFASKKLSFSFAGIFKNFNFYVAVFFYGLATVFFITALRAGDLSVLYPITALSYIWVEFLSVKVLKEKLNILKWFGISSIIFGVVLVTL